jgi:hypothetical protein
MQDQYAMPRVCDQMTPCGKSQALDIPYFNSCVKLGSN